MTNKQTPAFIYLEVFVPIDDGAEHTSSVQHISINIEYIVKFTSYGRYMWTSDGYRYTLTERGYKHLVESINKIEEDNREESELYILQNPCNRTPELSYGRISNRYRPNSHKVIGKVKYIKEEGIR